MLVYIDELEIEFEICSGLLIFDGVVFLYLRKNTVKSFLHLFSKRLEILNLVFVRRCIFTVNSLPFNHFQLFKGYIKILHMKYILYKKQYMLKRAIQLVTNWWKQYITYTPFHRISYSIFKGVNRNYFSIFMIGNC